jgi:hypothetical protein
MAAHLAASLYRARLAIDTRWPSRDRASDGWIGDAAHQGRNSDHNPNARDTVDALDIDMFGGATPVHRPSIVAAALVHPAIEYVIFNRRIFQRSDQFRPRVYDGINPHDKHCHYSTRQQLVAELDPAPWAILAHFPSWALLGKGRSQPVADVKGCQAYLNAWGSSLTVDGAFGALTDTAVRNYQRAHGLTVDGLVGPRTRAVLFS